MRSIVTPHTRRQLGDPDFLPGPAIMQRLNLIKGALRLHPIHIRRDNSDLLHLAGAVPANSCSRWSPVEAGAGDHIFVEASRSMSGLRCVAESAGTRGEWFLYTNATIPFDPYKASCLVRNRGRAGLSHQDITYTGRMTFAPLEASEKACNVLSLEMQKKNAFTCFLSTNPLVWKRRRDTAVKGWLLHQSDMPPHILHE